MDNRLSVLKEEYEKLKHFAKIEEKKKRLATLEKLRNDPEIWKDQNRAKGINIEYKMLFDDITEYEKMDEHLQYLIELEEMKDEDEELAKEYEKEIETFLKKLKGLEVKVVLNRPEDKKNAILTIHPGAGGTESQDWAQMLMRMYLRWIERKGYKHKILNLQIGDEAGIKDVTILVEGPYAYGYLKAERGIHRLVRISPFDASRRRHTSFASVFVYPEALDVEIEIKEDELRIDTFRSSGPGGQHMQKNETAVRITHIPTGIVVTCQSERSQFQNKQTALKILKSRLYELKLQEEKEKKGDIEKEKRDIGWGHQIRSYVMHPYKMVKDHRTGYETGNVDAVMDGDIDPFIESFLLSGGQT